MLEILTGLLGLLLGEVVLLACGVVALLVFLRLERTGRRETTVLIILGVLVLDCALFAPYGTTSGLFQPTFAGRSLSLTAVLTVVALVCRFTSAGPSTRIHPSAVWWTLFLAWTATAMVRGLAAGHSSSLVYYEGLVVLHVGGLAVLLATTPAARLVGRTGLPLLGMLVTPIAVLLSITDTALVYLDVRVPFVGGLVLGQMGADAATLFSSLGVLCGVLALAQPIGRRTGLAPAGVLLAAPLIAQQRAALLGLAAVVLIVAVGLAVQGRPRVLRLTSGEIALCVLLLATVGALAVTITTLTDVDTGLQDRVDRTFGGTAKQQSAESRLNQWEAGGRLVLEQPVHGHGLGNTYSYFEVGPDEFRRSDITHNVFLDVGVRTGLIGVLLLLGAVAASMMDAARALRSRAGAATRALALGAVAVLLGLITKGLVESLFEKHRLALLLGASIGLVLSAARAVSADTADPGAVAGTGVEQLSALTTVSAGTTTGRSARP